MGPGGGGSSSGSEADRIPFQLDEDLAPPQDFESFYAAHRDPVGRALSFAFNDHELGFEAADEAMARAYKRWSQVSTHANPAGWVFRVGLNWGRSWIRRRLTAVVKTPMILAGESGADNIEDLAVDTDLAAAIAAHGPDPTIRFLEAGEGTAGDFAGTFVMMARELGLPSRVAVGFTTGQTIDQGDNDPASSSLTFEIRDGDAHAWPEVYFEGIGWIAFEPTPDRRIPNAERYLGLPQD